MKTWYQENQGTFWSVLGAIVVIAIIVVAAVLRGPKDVAISNVQVPQQTALENKSPMQPRYYAPVAGETQSPIAPKLSYDAAVNKFWNMRIQFGENCVATPAVSTFKNGTELMIDNRSTQDKVFTVNGSSYPIAAHDYAVVPFTATTSPQKFTINCGVMQNAATVTVQN